MLIGKYDPERDPNLVPGVINHRKNNVNLAIIGWLDAPRQGCGFS
jgi:hypothetical protein